MPTLYSWNVNGIRAMARKGFLDWLAKTDADIVCIQETKAHPGDLEPVLMQPPGYTSFWQSAKKKGYSGVATYVRGKWEPFAVKTLGIPLFDDEGRVQILEFKGFTLVNAYYPNAQAERARLPYKLAFCSAMLDLCNSMRKFGKHVVVCGDLNIAHKEIDLARPKDNRDSPGFYIEECESMDQFIGAGYVDTFRHFTPDPGHYTWWSYRSNAREKNVGWRIDYHCVNKELASRLKASRIHCDVLGSDHCPVSITLS